MGCASDSRAQVAERIVREDTTHVAQMLQVSRGASPLVCEMTARTVDQRGYWSMWGPISGDPLVTDSASADVLTWVQRRHNDPALVPRLRAAMRDGDGCVRRVAASLLARVHHASATAALVQALDDASAGTREVAAFGLGMTQHEPAIDPLIARLRDASAPVRRAAAWALGQLEARKAEAPLLELLTRDPDPRVRQTAAWAVGSIRQ